ncbi:MAG: hypothetical protein LBT50_02445 [Prevotellaceae bacterium]|jgi:hypothetical protein|nr:hypothetical protein [Prevotellaceae bacterium]
MEQNPKSSGKCLFCGKTFAKAGINRHLKTHLEQKTTENPKGKSFFVKVETDPRYGNTPYFLSLWVGGTATMENLDDFLRNIWLECCGHMSEFTNPAKRMQGGGMWGYFEAMELLERGKQKEYEELMEETNGEISMSRKVSQVFYKGLALKYEYDFGSSTNLQLTVMDEYPVKADKKIVLLSRNEPLEWLCDLCQKEPATQICTVHDWGDDSMFCDKCAKKHARKCSDFREYASMPVVNSPRMGVCAYTGGAIDIERDGVFVKQ